VRERVAYLDSSGASTLCVEATAEDTDNVAAGPPAAAHAVPVPFCAVNSGLLLAVRLASRV
jgi:hypothetical protein